MKKLLSQNPWIICLPAGLFFFYEFAQITIFNSLAPSIMQTFSIDALVLANLSSCYFCTNLLFLIPIGLLLDRVSTKKLMILFMSLSVGGTLILSFAPNLTVAAIGRLLSGIGGSIVFIGGIKILSQRFPYQKLSFVIALFVTMGYLGGVVGQTPFVVINNLFGWRASLQILSAVGIAILFLMWLVLQDKHLSKTNIANNTTRPLTIFASMKLVCGNLYTWLGGVYTMLMNLPIIVLAALWNGLYLEEVDHLTNLKASYVTTSLLIGIMIGSPIVGWISSHYKITRHIMVLSAILSLGIVTTIILIPHPFLYLLIILFFALGFFSSAQCLGYPVIIENNDLRTTAIASSIGSILVMGGGALLKVLFGLILDATWKGTLLNGVRIYNTHSFHVALAILPIGFILSSIIAHMVRPLAEEKS